MYDYGKGVDDEGNLLLDDSEIIKSLINAFKHTSKKVRVDADVDARISGTTAITCLLHGRKLFCANVGDSRAVLYRYNHHAPLSKYVTISNSTHVSRSQEDISHRIIE